jgi:quercetin dioxygenase-like cupin family protein
VGTDTIRLSATQVLRVVGSSPEELQLESTWAPGAKKPPAHWHPRQHEHFELLAGRLTVEIEGGAAQLLGPGDTIDIPPRVVHRMWDAGSDPVRASWRVSPRLRTEEMFRYMEAGMSPIRGARLLWTFRHELRLGKPRRQ